MDSTECRRSGDSYISKDISPYHPKIPWTVQLRIITSDRPFTGKTISYRTHLRSASCTAILPTSGHYPLSSGRTGQIADGRSKVTGPLHCAGPKYHMDTGVLERIAKVDLSHKGTEKNHKKYGLPVQGFWAKRSVRRRSDYLFIPYG